MSYASHIGRVGALAVALGVGIAVATTPGIAYAEEPSNTDSVTSTTDNSSTDGTDGTDETGSGDEDIVDGDDSAEEDIADDVEGVDEDGDGEEGLADGGGDGEEEPTSDAGDEETPPAAGDEDGAAAQDDDSDQDSGSDDTADQQASRRSASAHTVADASEFESFAAAAPAQPTRSAGRHSLADAAARYNLAPAMVDALKSIPTTFTAAAAAPAPAPASAVLAPAAPAQRPTLVSIFSDLVTGLLNPGTGSPFGIALSALLLAVRDEIERIFFPGTAAPASALTLLALSPNLLANGDAETATPTLTGFSATTVPGWDPDGTPAIIPYGLPRAYPSPFVIEFPALPDPWSFPKAPSGGGANFFGGGAQVTTAISQTVDLSAAAAEIDGGSVPYALSALLGGYSWDPSAASVTVHFKDGGGVSTGTGNIGPVSLFDRLGQTQMMDRETSGTIPKLTRTAEVVVNFTNSNTGFDHYNNAYADKISFRVDSVTPVAPNVLTEPAKWGGGAGKLDHVFVVYLENKGYNEITGPLGRIDTRTQFPFNILSTLLGPFGKPPYVWFGAPYLNLLSDGNVSATNYHGLMHPSNINYSATLGGTDFGQNSNCFENCLAGTDTDPTMDPISLMDNIENKGLTWAGYGEDNKGYKQGVDGGLPFLQFKNIFNNPARFGNRVFDLNQLKIDLELRDRFPNFAWLAANDEHNMEGPTTGAESEGSTTLGPLSISAESLLWLGNFVGGWIADRLGVPPSIGIHQYNTRGGSEWLEQTLPVIFASDIWNDPTKKVAIFVTFDEDNDNLTVSRGNVGNHVYFASIPNKAAIAAGMKAKGTDDANYNHYNLLRTIEDALGLDYLTDNDRYAKPMDGLWGP